MEYFFVSIAAIGHSLSDYILDFLFLKYVV